MSEMRSVGFGSTDYDILRRRAQRQCSSIGGQCAEVAHHIEMQRNGFDIFGPAFTQTVQMPSVAVSFEGGIDSAAEIGANMCVQY